MQVTSVSFRNWRNIPEASVFLNGGINVLWGMNAQGKSNILEGVYYFARGRSFRSAHERDLVRFGADAAAAVLRFRRDGYTMDTQLEVQIPRSGKKRILRGGAPLSSISEMIGSFRAVLFCPANLTLVTGGPGERRTFLDIALAQLSEAYLYHLRRYTKYLAERNALIKQAADGVPVNQAQWETYAEGMSTSGAWISAYRAEYVNYLAEAVTRYFDGMTEGAEKPTLTYKSHGLCEDMPRPLMKATADPDPVPLFEKLTANIEREIIVGSTLWGVHKDDIILDFNDREAKVYASQGQQRSIVLSMKLAEAEIAKTVGGEYPVVLLDDVFSELDENRRRYILESLGREEGRQIIITSCEPDVIPDRRDGVTFRRVHGGLVE